jgi:diguanylate cyclase (GGDEF)-like protein
MAGMVDIDDFKVLNDRHGDATGDSALSMLAARLRHAVGTYGVAGRLGGDEFGLFLVVPEAQVDVVTDALHAACAPFEIHPGQQVAASLGLRSVDSLATIDSAMLLADEALYAMKTGRRPSSHLRAAGTHD